MSSPKDLDLIGSCKSAQQSRRDSEELSMDGLDPEIQKTGSRLRSFHFRIS